MLPTSTNSTHAAVDSETWKRKRRENSGGIRLYFLFFLSTSVKFKGVLHNTTALPTFILTLPTFILTFHRAVKMPSMFLPGALFPRRLLQGAEGRVAVLTSPPHRLAPRLCPSVRRCTYTPFSRGAREEGSGESSIII